MTEKQRITKALALLRPLQSGLAHAADDGPPLVRLVLENYAIAIGVICDVLTGDEPHPFAACPICGRTETHTHGGES